MAKRLGLRNNNGLTGGQDGYEFQYNANVNSPAWTINIPDAFEDALTTWCNETEIRFKRKEGTVFTQAVANDGVNVIVVGSLSTANAQAALIQSQAYFPIDCNGSDPEDEDGGFIMADLDFVVDNDFALAMPGDQARAQRVFEHEIGHGHNTNHARCFGFACSGPLMEATAETGIKDVDVDGGNEIFDDSETIINNGCTGSSVPPVPIETGNCGMLVADREEHKLNLLIAPNPTTEKVLVKLGDQPFNWKVTNSTGQILSSGKTSISDFEIDFSGYPSGTYILLLEGETGIGQFKIVKL